jgi:hypothetical protein
VGSVATLDVSRRDAWVNLKSIHIHIQSFNVGNKFYTTKETQMSINWNLVRNVPLALALAIPLAACEQEGPAERAGEQIDQSAEQAADQAENAAERAGEAAEEAGDRVRSGTQ